MENSLEARAQRAMIRTADIVRDIDMKLSHIIDYKSKEYYRNNGSDYHP